MALVPASWNGEHWTINGQQFTHDQVNQLIAGKPLASAQQGTEVGSYGMFQKILAPMLSSPLKPYLVDPALKAAGVMPDQQQEAMTTDAAGVFRYGVGPPGQEEFQLPAPPEVIQGLNQGKTHFQIASERRNPALGDLDLIQNRIDPLTWQRKQTQADAGDFAREGLPKERRLAGALISFSPLATNRDNYDYVKNMLPWVGPITDGLANRFLRQSLEKYAEGTADSRDYLIMGKALREMQEAYAAQEAGQKRGIKPWMRGFADMAAQVPGYVAEFAAGLGAASGATRAAKAATSGALARRVSSAVGGALKGRIPAAVAATAKDLGPFAAKAATVTAAMPQRVFQAAEQNRLAGESSPFSAWAQATVDNLIDTATEMGVGKSLAVLGDAAKGSAVAKLATKLDGFWTRVVGAKGKQALAKLEQQNPFVEYLEEVFAAEAKRLTTAPESETLATQLASGNLKDALYQQSQIFLTSMLPSLIASGTADRKQVSQAVENVKTIIDAQQEPVEAEVVPQTEAPTPTPAAEQVEDELTPYLQGEAGQIAELAALPDQPSRKQIATIFGLEREAVRLPRTRRADLVTRARQMVEPESQPAANPLDVLDLPEEEKARALAAVEAEDGIKKQLESMSPRQIATRFKFKKGRSKSSMIAEILDKQVRPYRLEETNVTPEQDRREEAQVQAEVQDEDQVQDARQEVLAPQVSPAPVSASQPSSQPPAPASPLVQQWTEKLTRDYSNDLPGLVALAETVGVKLPKKLSKARAELTAEQLIPQVADHMASIKAEPEELAPEPETQAPAAPEPITEEPAPAVEEPVVAEVVKKKKPKKAERRAKLIDEAVRVAKAKDRITISNPGTAETEPQREVESFAKSLGVQLVFADMEFLPGYAYWRGKDHVVFVSRSLSDVDALWEVASHEIAHGSGYDTLKDLFGKERVLEAVDEYRRRSPGRDLSDFWEDQENHVLSDKGWQEGMAVIFGKLMRDESFRLELLENSPGVWRKIMDAIVKFFARIDRYVRDPEAVDLLNRLKAEMAVYDRVRQQIPAKVGRPSEYNNDVFSLRYKLEAALDEYEAELGNPLPTAERKNLLKELESSVREKHNLKYEQAKERNAARKAIRKATQQNKISLARVENAGKDFSGMNRAKWDVFAEPIAREHPLAFPNISDSTDYAARAFELVRKGDEEVPLMSQHQDILHEALGEILYAGRDTPTDPPSSIQQELDEMSKDWNSEDWQAFNQVSVDIADTLNEQLGEGDFPLEPKDDRVVARAMEWMRETEAGEKEQETLVVPEETKEDEGFSLFAPGGLPELPPNWWKGKPAAEAAREHFRHKGRTNPARTIGQRTLVYHLDKLVPESQRRPHSVADEAAKTIYEADPDGVRKAVLRGARDKLDIKNLEVESALRDKLVDEISLPAVMGSKKAVRDAHALIADRRGYRREVARTLGRRDPLMLGTPQQRREYYIKSAILDTETAEESDKLIEELKTIGVTAENILQMLEDEAKVLEIVRKIRSLRSKAGYSDMAFEWFSNAILSGIQTHMVNMTSNAAWATWTLGPERILEATLNDAYTKISGRPARGATLSELKDAWKGTMNGLRPAWRNMISTFRWEQSALAVQLGIQDETAEKLGAEDADITKRFAIPGAIGRAARTMGWRPLSAADDLFKTMVAYGQAAVHAHRTAKRLGLRGDRMARLVENELQDFSSSSWALAYDDAKVATFQQTETKTAEKILQAGLSLRRIPTGRWWVPFVRFPVTAFEAVVQRMPMIGLAYAAGERNIFGEEQNWGRVMARQILGGAATMAIWGMMNGDGSDDESAPFITGSSEQRYSARGMQWRTAPPQSIRINGKYRSYARVEPFSTVVSMIVDQLDTIKKKGIQEVPAQAWRSLSAQAADKTFMQTVGDIIKISEGEGSIWDLPTGVAAGMVPNIYRQTSRNIRNTIYDQRIRKDDRPRQIAKKTLMKAELPYLGVNFKRDVWGRPITPYTPTTSAGERILNPIRPVLDIKDRLPADVALMRWTEIQERDGKNAWNPGPPMRTMFGNQPKMTDDEYEQVIERRGAIALQAANRLSFSNPPTEWQINRLQKIFAAASRQAKAELAQKRRNQPGTGD